MKSHQVLARHILDAIVRIESYVQGVQKGDFKSNFMLQDAVIRQLAIIGEASRNMPSHIKQKFPDIPWREIVAMRNKLIHEYFGLDSEIIWNVIHLSVPDLKAYAQRILTLNTE